MHESIETEVLMLIACFDLEHGSPMQPALIHVPIVETLRSSDVEAAIAEMQKHIAAPWSNLSNFCVYLWRAQNSIKSCDIIDGSDKLRGALK